MSELILPDAWEKTAMTNDQFNDIKKYIDKRRFSQPQLTALLKYIDARIDERMQERIGADIQYESMVVINAITELERALFVDNNDDDDDTSPLEGSFVGDHLRSGWD